MHITAGKLAYFLFQQIPSDHKAINGCVFIVGFIYVSNDKLSVFLPIDKLHITFILRLGHIAKLQINITEVYPIPHIAMPEKQDDAVLT